MSRQRIMRSSLVGWCKTWLSSQSSLCRRHRLEKSVKGPNLETLAWAAWKSVLGRLETSLRSFETGICLSPRVLFRNDVTLSALQRRPHFPTKDSSHTSFFKFTLPSHSHRESKAITEPIASNGPQQHGFNATNPGSESDPEAAP